MLLKNITKIYHNKNNTIEALKDMNLEFNSKGITTILGPSGCGKTTLLHIIAGLDHDFTGEIIGDETIEIIEQELTLFESMSVIDNLLICGNYDDCVALLEKFQLINEKNKIVKNLSIGQKKRVQIMRSLLVQPDILLCDEPTASLDHENREIVMNMLKDISHECCVIVVTHETDIAQIYSDRIISIDDGEIIDDQIIHSQEMNQLKKHQMNHKTISYKISFLFKNMKSRKLYHLLNIVLIFCMLISLFVSMNMLETTSSHSKENMNVYFGKNIVSLTPLEEYNQNERCYSSFDLMTYAQIEEILNQVDEIIGCSFGINDSIFDYSQYFTWDEETDERIDSIDLTPFHQKYNEDQSASITLPPEVPYLQLTNKKNNHDSSSSTLVYQLNDDASLPLIYGNQCEKDNEIIVDYSLAQMLCDKLGLKFTENLIGKEVEYSLVCNESYSVVTNRVIPPSFTFTVSGITKSESIYEYQLFIPSETWIHSFSDACEISVDDWHFDEVNFYIDPQCDIDDVIQKINTIYQGKDSSFEHKRYDDVVWYNLKRNIGKYQTVKDPIDTSLFIKGSLIIIVVMMGLYVVLDCLNMKRKRKENRLYDCYGYSSLFMGLIKDIGYMIIVGLLLFVFGDAICLSMNTLVESLFSDYALRDALMSFDVLKMLIVLIIGSVGVILEGVIMNVYSSRKH